MRQFKQMLFWCLSLSFILSIAQASTMVMEIEGSWTARIRDGKIRMQLTIFRDEDSWGEWSSSRYFVKEDFTGLSFGNDQSFQSGGAGYTGHNYRGRSLPGGAGENPR